MGRCARRWTRNPPRTSARAAFAGRGRGQRAFEVPEHDLRAGAEDLLDRVQVRRRFGREIWRTAEHHVADGGDGDGGRGSGAGAAVRGRGGPAGRVGGGRVRRGCRAGHGRRPAGGRGVRHGRGRERAGRQADRPHRTGDGSRCSQFHEDIVTAGRADGQRPRGSGQTAAQSARRCVGRGVHHRAANPHPALGRHWTTVSSPNVGSASQLTSVSASPGAAIVWAAGYSGVSGSFNPLTLGNG
jgi:hypothetical protein